MVHYVLANEEQKEFGEGAYEIVSKELGDRIEEFENADGGLGVYPQEVHDKLVEAGYYAVSISEELGGVGLDPVTEAIILEKIGEVDAGFAFAFASAQAQNREFPLFFLLTFCSIPDRIMNVSNQGLYWFRQGF